MTAQDNINAEQFAAHVQKHGGATASLSTGKFIQPGTKNYMVGGESGSSGDRISTRVIPSNEFGPEHVTKFAGDVSAALGGNAHRVHVGAWSFEGGVALDASRVTKRRGEAIRKGTNRGEDSIWDNKRMREVKTGGKVTTD